MSDALSNAFTITLESDSNKHWHTLDDWGLALGNTDYIGQPEMETTYIDVPGRDGFIDASEVVSGRRVYKKRSLAFELGGLHESDGWDSVISGIRNNIDGRICRIVMDNDPAYFWRGRVYVTKYDRSRRLGKFTLAMPMADPYKYDLTSSAEPWLWDPFNFETGVITQLDAEIIVGSGSVTIPHGNMQTTPQFVVSDMISQAFTVEYDSVTYSLTTGTNTIPSIFVGGDTDVTLNFTGSATVQVVYRGGSL